jgi:hypothetical protein
MRQDSADCGPLSTKIGEAAPSDFSHKQLDFTERTSDDAKETNCVYNIQTLEAERKSWNLSC